MGNGIQTKDLIRLVGVMALAVAVAWLVQVLDFGGSSALGRLMWVLAAAAIAGGGTGLIFTSVKLRDADGKLAA